MPAAAPVLIPGTRFHALVVVYNLPRDSATGEPLGGVALEIDTGDEVLRVSDFEVIGSRYEPDRGITQLILQGTLPARAPVGNASLWVRVMDATSGRRVEERSSVFISGER